MDHTHIIQASDLDRYASTQKSQAVIPELIYLLVTQSYPNPMVCRIPYGDSVNQPGWDGIVETNEAFLEFVPKGKSYWEIGTGADPQSKATVDFNKRTNEIDDVKRADSSFVFVTPRSFGSGGWNEPEQTKWLERRKDKGWKLVRVIDGVKLADWLREYPAIGKWMATKLCIMKDLGGLSTATEHWENLVSKRTASDPPLPPKLFTVGRNAACEALQALFEGKTNILRLFAESPQDVPDFVSAFLTGLDPDTSQAFSNRCLYVNDEQAWRSIVETRSLHVLVANPRLGLETEEGAELQTIAHRKGHSVIVPLCGAWSRHSPEILKLRSPTQSQIEAVLKESGYSDIQAKELSRIGGDRISALRRHLRGYGDIPPYATWENATLIAQAGLVGKWDGSNRTDRSALEKLLGKGYGEWIERLRPDTLRSDSPLIQHDEKWRFVARGEAWSFLGNRITDDDLTRFQETAVSVLEERDPQFDLPKEDRFAASVRGKAFTHSNLIRKGIAETLALLGSLPKALSSCTERKAEGTAILVVHCLLNEANWERWASLDSIMPLLAEAAPDKFLDAVESVLVDSDNTPFHKIFAEEGGGALGGGHYMTGLLWALETLAWSPEHLSRVSVILADIASIDPGGNLANRPLNSLADIFLPWHVQTTAPFEKRKSAIQAVLNEQPVVCWKLLLALLPHSHGYTTGCRRPIWREYIPRDWKDGVLESEYWEQITAFSELSIVLAKTDPVKLCELIERLTDLPEPAHNILLEYLTTNEIISLPEADRLPLWESLDKLVRHHRKFSDAEELPEDSVNKIAETAQALAPNSLEFKYHYLFSGRDFDLFDEKENYDEQRERLDKARQAAISEILGDSNLDAVLKFATKIAAPYEVGRTLGVIASDELEVAILPSLLDSEDDTLVRVIAGFIWTRFRKLRTDWLEAVLKRNWTPKHRAKFLTLLPFNEEIWKRISLHLKESHEALYWKNVRVNPYGRLDCDSKIAIEKLLRYGREGAAVMCIARTADDESRFDESLATRALVAVLGSERGINELDSYQTVKLIKHLQESETADKDALFRIEWGFLPWLDRFSTGSPVTLEKRLASDPAFFAEVVRLVFRSKNTRKDDSAEPDEKKKNLATNAYKLLTEWKRCPGTQDDGSFNAEAFNAWIKEARRITEESGHAEVSQIQIGHVLTYASPDPDGLWIHNAVAKTLNSRDTDEMRSGFTTELFNRRGAYQSTHGQEERKLASENWKKVKVLDCKGYTRFAAAMREVAKRYDRQAEYEAKRDPFEY